MPRKTTDPTTNEHGVEVHPSWGLASVHRASGGDAVLFDSEIRHNSYIAVRVATASRQRDLSRDWLHREDEFLEFVMSESQWAAFVSSVGSGSGVPCTIRRREDDWDIPEFPYAPRMQESMKEVRGAADRSLEEIREAFALVEEKPTKANIRNLGIVLGNAPANMTYAAKSLSEHAENVVQKARADMEAIVTARARELGLADTDGLALMPGTDDD